MPITAEQFIATLFVIMSAAENEDAAYRIITGCEAIVENKRLVDIAVNALNSRDQ